MAMAKNTAEAWDILKTRLGEADQNAWKDVKYRSPGVQFDYSDRNPTIDQLTCEIQRLTKTPVFVVKKILLCEWEVINTIFRETGLDTYLVTKCVSELTGYPEAVVWNVISTEEFISWKNSNCDIYPGKDFTGGAV